MLLPEAGTRIRALIPTAQIVILRPAGRMELLEPHGRSVEIGTRCSTACFEPGHVSLHGER